METQPLATTQLPQLSCTTPLEPARRIMIGRFLYRCCRPVAQISYAALGAFRAELCPWRLAAMSAGAYSVVRGARDMSLAVGWNVLQGMVRLVAPVESP